MPARSRARKRAVDLLFEADQRGLDPVTLIPDRMVRLDDGAVLPPYAITLVEGVREHAATIDELLGTYSHGWTVDRMPAVDRAILRLATWELMYNDDVPDVVAIDEAVDLATMLSTDDSPNFVNGLLGRLLSVKTDQSKTGQARAPQAGDREDGETRAVPYWHHEADEPA